MRDGVAGFLKARYGVEMAVVIEQPKQASFGELALPVAFSLAKARKKAPRAIAEEIAANLPAIPGIASVEVAGGGYLNVLLDRGAYAMGLLAGGDVGLRRSLRLTAGSGCAS